MDLGGSRIPMPWYQLTDITFSTNSISHTFLDIFGQCMNVARASISVTGWSIIPPDSGLNMLLFEHLRDLSVDCGREVHNMRFLDCISAPALDELHLFFAYERGAEWAKASLTAFQLRSPNITKFENYGHNSRLPPSNALTAALLHAPSLTHLSVRSCRESIDDAFLRALCYTEGVQPLVPCLHTLVLTDLVGDVSEDVLASMITSRWWTDVDLALHAMPPIAAQFWHVFGTDPQPRISGQDRRFAANWPCSGVGG
ncbi:hypothetical protein K438DRAFT_815338 [Mycena galopus ATCC 62051]|nr:hypothetical protein K438DRAFT_815338 [Mycena galopus ATCC 62051]